MASSSSSASSPLLFSSSSALRNPNSDFSLPPCSIKFCGIKRRRFAVAASSSEDDLSPQKSTKLVTFLGKGGSGKTTSAIFAAQHYAMAGLSTCLVIHSQDPTAEYLLNCKIGTSAIKCNNNLSAVRLETTKMLLEPLNRLKQADARLNLTQGVLEGVGRRRRTWDSSWHGFYFFSPCA
ncbi:hypothetical protein L1049_005837 [Liquidambar formosana]|uniref:ArsA/GET3 Anion-transporting ATPase-like domain-containing protein n=1 Tax=Liquidambar formosana TaxID=63359 RepID=A0AAP0REF6_LIQFO